MVEPLSLVTIQALAAETSAYGGNRVVTPMTAATLLSAAVWLSDYDNWVGAGYSLTTSEKDEIDWTVAQAIDDLLQESAFVSDFVKIGETVKFGNVVNISVDGLDPTGYHCYKIFVSGMLTNSVLTWGDKVKFYLNDEKATGKYTSFGMLFYNNVQLDLEADSTEDAIIINYSALAQVQSSEFFGALEMTLFGPSLSTVKQLQYDGLLGGFTMGKIARVVGQGTAKVSGDITKITLEPYDGTTFLIDTVSNLRPDELRMTVYGLR